MGEGLDSHSLTRARGARQQDLGSGVVSGDSRANCEAPHLQGHEEWGCVRAPRPSGELVGGGRGGEGLTRRRGAGSRLPVMGQITGQGSQVSCALSGRLGPES